MALILITLLDLNESATEFLSIGPIDSPILSLSIRIDGPSTYFRDLTDVDSTTGYPELDVNVVSLPIVNFVLTRGSKLVIELSSVLLCSALLV